MKIVDGMIHGSRILHNRYSNLEHGELSSVNGIILHQTNSTTAFPTLLAYYWRSVGAHFLIAPGGMIYQTARMDRVCFHVGAIKSKCRVTHTCTPDQTKALKSILASSLPQKDKDFAIHQLEMKKPAHLRYPSNLDSLGIEVVGASKDDQYASPTAAQNAASVWLIDALMQHLNLKRTAVYRHPEVSRKLESEASQVAY
ncbi:peptidoglycan recognition protein family protein [Acidovorax sp. NCPPB 3576]|uniref:peptidoglycan recognition protein family protein n=1 Tax=Acidovorax sp. NCPPB 3576 TaxID=2940488 RepID=UPI00234B40E2|nr:N-acetylmuramoyl-L-alanine amidase [Acidovorax sp. NCPPB 3576]WCM89284.1 N-acetylmuramoyl-L-alanine amidase [Acidovorax sp. NCPPB 3576]